MAERRYIADPVHRDTILMNAAWCGYSTMILLVAASVAWERRQLRSGASLRVSLPASFKLSSEQRVDGKTVLISHTSVTIKSDEAFDLARGMSIPLLLGDRRLYCKVTALVAHSAGRRQHLYLPDLSDEQERQLERLAYSNSKRSLHKYQATDRPLRSLLQIFLLAVRGV